MPKEGQVWPIQLAFLLLLVLGLVVVIDPRLFGQQDPITRLTGFWLLIAAFVVAAVLYSPLLIQRWLGGGSIIEWIGEPNAAQPAPNSIIGRLEAIQLRTDAIGDPNAAAPAANTILGLLRIVELQGDQLPHLLDARRSECGSAIHNQRSRTACCCFKPSERARDHDRPDWHIG